MYKINSWIGKSFKSDKNNITFHTTECIYFIRERDAWFGKNHSKYSYKDFNKNESVIFIFQ